MKQNEAVSRWLTEGAAAKIMGLGIHTLRAHKYKSTGRPYSKIGRAVRYKLLDIIDFREEKTVELKRQGD